MKALFVDRASVIAKSPLNGNIDPDKLMQYIELAQDIHVQQQLGTDLYNKLQADITGGTLAGAYLTLVESYVKPMLIHYTVLEYLHYAAYSIANGGLFKRSPDNTITVDKVEVDFLIEKQRMNAQFYSDLYNRYMCANSALYPEYKTNDDDGLKPNRGTNFTNWVL